MFILKENSLMYISALWNLQYMHVAPVVGEKKVKVDTVKHGRIELYLKNSFFWGGKVEKYPSFVAFVRRRFARPLPINLKALTPPPSLQNEEWKFDPIFKADDFTNLGYF